MSYSKVGSNVLSSVNSTNIPYLPNTNVNSLYSNLDGSADLGSILNGSASQNYAGTNAYGNLDSNNLYPGASDLQGVTTGQLSSVDQSNNSSVMDQYILMLTNWLNSIMLTASAASNDDIGTSDSSYNNSTDYTSNSYLPNTTSTYNTSNSSYWPSTSSTYNTSNYTYNNGTSTNSSNYSSNGSYTRSGSLEANIDFENGQFPGTAPNTKEPAKIMTDANGNKFIRFTANYGDQEGVPTYITDRVRATMYMNGPHWEMPEVNNSNNKMSYNADIRFIDNKSKRGYSNNSFFELFQGSSTYKSKGYDASDSPSGPPVRFIRKDNGHVVLQTEEDDGVGQLKWKQYDFGYFAPGEFHNFRLDATWDKQNGGYQVYIDNKPRLAINGICTFYNPTKSNLLPAMKCGLYGSNAVGSVDVDNVKIYNNSNS